MFQETTNYSYEFFFFNQKFRNQKGKQNDYLCNSMALDFLTTKHRDILHKLSTGGLALCYRA